MTIDTTPRLSWREIAAYVLAYALWLITVLMCVQAILQIRLSVSAVWVVGGADRYRVALVDQSSLLLVGFAAFMYLVWVEHYYREGVMLRISPKLSDKVPMLPQGRVAGKLAGLGLDLVLRRFAFTFAIPLGLDLLALVVWHVALNALTPVR